MNKENNIPVETEGQNQPTCNVNTAFNTMVGIVSIIVAVVIGYIVYISLG